MHCDEWESIECGCHTLAVSHIPTMHAVGVLFLFFAAAMVSMFQTFCLVVCCRRLELSWTQLNMHATFRLLCWPLRRHDFTRNAQPWANSLLLPCANESSWFRAVSLFAWVWLIFSDTVHKSGISTRLYLAAHDAVIQELYSSVLHWL